MPPSWCCAPGCQSGSVRVLDDQEGDLIQFYEFPEEEDGEGGRRKAWVRAVKKRNWTPSEGARLCSLHFRPEDFDGGEGEVIKKTKRKRRRKVKEEREYGDGVDEQEAEDPLRIDEEKPTLRSDAVPSVFFQKSKWLDMVRWRTKERRRRSRNIRHVRKGLETPTEEEEGEGEGGQDKGREVDDGAPVIVNSYIPSGEIAGRSPKSLCCVVKGCGNDAYDLAKGVAFFSFPRDRDLQVRLSQLLGHGSRWNPPSLGRLCSRHFNPECALLVTEEEKGRGETNCHGTAFDFLGAPPRKSPGELPTVTIATNLDAKGYAFWRTVCQFYQDGLFCDVNLVRCGMLSKHVAS